MSSIPGKRTNRLVSGAFPPPSSRGATPRGDRASVRTLCQQGGSPCHVKTTAYEADSNCIRHEVGWEATGGEPAARGITNPIRRWCRGELAVAREAWAPGGSDRSRVCGDESDDRTALGGWGWDVGKARRSKQRGLCGSGEPGRSQSPHGTAAAYVARGPVSKPGRREGGQEGGCEMSTERHREHRQCHEG